MTHNRSQKIFNPEFRFRFRFRFRFGLGGVLLGNEFAKHTTRKRRSHWSKYPLD